MVKGYREAKDGEKVDAMHLLFKHLMYWKARKYKKDLDYKSFWLGVGHGAQNAFATYPYRRASADMAIHVSSVVAKQGGKAMYYETSSIKAIRYGLCLHHDGQVSNDITIEGKSTIAVCGRRFKVLSR